MTNNCPLCGNQMPEKRIYTREEIKQLCADMDTFAKCSDELHAAMREGRIKE